MMAVIFEVTPATGQRSAYLDAAAALKPLLVQISRSLESQALAASEPVIVLADFQKHINFSPVADRYRQISEFATLAAITTVDEIPDLPARISHRRIPKGSPAVQNWTLMLLGSFFSAASCLMRR